MPFTLWGGGGGPRRITKIAGSHISYGIQTWGRKTLHSKTCTACTAARRCTKRKTWVFLCCSNLYWSIMLPINHTRQPMMDHSWLFVRGRVSKWEKNWLLASRQLKWPPSVSVICSGSEVQKHYGKCAETDGIEVAARTTRFQFRQGLWTKNTYFGLCNAWTNRNGP